APSTRRRAATSTRAVPSSCRDARSESPISSRSPPVTRSPATSIRHFKSSTGPEANETKLSEYRNPKQTRSQINLKRGKSKTLSSNQVSFEFRAFSHLKLFRVSDVEFEFAIYSASTATFRTDLAR